MKLARSSLDSMVRAFRELTDAPADGAVTRARVLANAGRAASRRVWLRRLGVPIAAVLVTVSSVSAALPLAQRRWRAAAPARLDLGDTGGAPAAPVTVHASRVIPPQAVTGDTAIAGTSSPAYGAAPAEDEATAYGRAHRAHFQEDRPARALAAWDHYLAAFPHGSFAPEASYNRAICLLRLGRYPQAARALRPLARQPAGAYRRDEARQLLDWLDGNGSENSSDGVAPATNGGEERARHVSKSGQFSGSRSSPDRGRHFNAGRVDRVDRVDFVDSGPR